MAYYIFLKCLRSLEEFRKNPHVKIPPKSPCVNLQSLGKFKNLIFNSKISFPRFRPGRPCGPLGLWPSRLPLASLLSWAEFNSAGPSRSTHACRWRICRNTFSSLIHAFRSWRLLSIHLLTHGIHLSVLSSPPRRPTPAVTPPCRRSPLSASDATKPLPPASSLSPLNPPSNRALMSLNGLNHHSLPPLLRPPLRRPP
jgi:hypothetical protein